MKKFVNNIVILNLLLMICFSVGCEKSGTSETALVKITMYTPVYKTLTEVRANMKTSAPRALEQTGKIYLFGKYIFMNEVNKGIHVIDNTNPSRPKNISFINIPGNVDIAAQGNYLYADSYADMIVLDISNPMDVSVKKIVEKSFPDRSYYYWQNTNNPDSIRIVADYIKKDTLVEGGSMMWFGNFTKRESSGQMLLASAAVAKGVGGSMARFTIVNEFLYTVSLQSLSAYSIANPAEPVLQHVNKIGWGIETVYPFKDRLFIGSTSGMFIYDISNPAIPAPLGQISHVRSCDPVVADDTHAFVTLRSGSMCAGFSNQLEVLDVSNLSHPVRLKIYPMTNPHGLSKDGNLLFICDGNDGLKLYNTSNVTQLKKLDEVDGIDAYDVIAQHKLAIVVAKEGLYQYDYSTPSNIRFLSKISVAH